MDLSNLPKIVKRPAKRVGRGYGSGKGGHTSSRGTKGQKAREKVPLAFEGTKVKKSLLKRLPLLRGKGKFKAWGKKFTPINIGKLADWPAKVVVSEQTLRERGLIKHRGEVVKLVGKEKLKQSLVVKTAVSAGARERIEAAGGKIEGDKK